MDDETAGLAKKVLAVAGAVGLKIATAESCTGGLVIAALTDIAGSSAVVDRGFITYSNAAKIEMLGVPETLIAGHGAVSEAVARAMAAGALAKSGADLAVAVTGVAGPGGGSAEKPVGLVHFACAGGSNPVDHQVHRFGDSGGDIDRAGIRRLAVVQALRMLADAAEWRGRARA